MSTVTSARVPLLFAITTCLFVCACGSGGSEAPTQVPGGQLVARGDGTWFVQDAHYRGDAARLHIEELVFGRLVDIYDSVSDPTDPGASIETLRLSNFLVGADVAADGLDLLLSANPVTQRERLVLVAPIGSAKFAALLSKVTQNLSPVLTRGLTGAAATPPFTGIPRNAAVAMRFDDLLDASTVDASTLQVLVGDPASVPFELRILPDPSHGGLAQGGFHSTRVLFDFAISGFESKQSGGKIEPNPLGLPAATQVGAPNLALRLPSVVVTGQYGRLENLSGHGLDLVGNGPVDLSSPSQDVVRGMRSQGKTELTGDPNNGFLPDDIAPSILGAQGISLSALVPIAGAPDEYRADLVFATPACAMEAALGDVVEMPGGTFAEVVGVGQFSPGSATLVGLRLRRFGNGAELVPGQGILRATWSPDRGVAPECFVRVDPLPNTLPDQGLSTKAGIIVAFSEPMDPSSVQGLETFTVRYETPPNGNPMWANVVGRVQPSTDLREFEFEPSVPLRHTSGSAEAYLVDVVGDDPQTGTGGSPLVEGITDLAGNALTFDMTSRYGDPEGALRLHIDPQEPTRVSAGIAFHFDSLDEDLDGAPELRGQYLIDASRGTIAPRSVTRFSAVIDDQQATIGAMPLTPSGLVTPLSNFGSKTQTVWRYVDMGFGLLDDTTHNLDVEGLWWAPFGQDVQQDTFSKLQISLAHASALPDEGKTPLLLPNHPQSGLQQEFGLNAFDSLTDVTQPAQGYFLDPSLTKLASTGLKIFPWPLNLNVAPKDFKHWTWRDTAKTRVAGRVGPGSGVGADPNALTQAVGVSLEGFYPQGEIPTIGLPLMTEFRCFPDDGAFGLNGFKTSFGILNSPLPAFRAFSTGGVAGANIITINPGSSPVAQGGVNPMTGQQTAPLDNTVYWGQADFVLRVSRVHTAWLDTGAAHSFGQVVFEPDLLAQPNDTSVSVAFRGASSLSSTGSAPWANALNLDPYGNSFSSEQITLLATPGLAEFDVQPALDPLDGGWRPSLADIDQSRYVQMRISFLSSAASNLSPELSSLGFGFIQ